MDRFACMEKTKFLGREFLLWLWYCEEQSPDTLQGFLPEGSSDEELRIFLDNKIIFEPLLAMGDRYSLSGEEPSTSPEAAYALQLNKIPSEVKLKVVRGDRGWSLAIKGDDLQIRSLKIPKVLSPHEEEHFSERMYLLDEIEDVLQSVFVGFVRLRISAAWALTRQAIQQWIEQKV